ncbi:MAG TPA: histidine kinase [Firmicutes bacterium]|nr:histidine kinase [Candidatus Fermentithermobacillaceae bacterium]
MRVGLDSGRIMGQEFEWGQIEWLQLCDTEGPSSIGLGSCTLYPNGHDEPHHHYNEEQVLYGLSGSCIQVVNGKALTLGPGLWVHVPPGSTHEMYNPFATPCRFLLFTSPVLRVDLFDERFSGRTSSWNKNRTLLDRSNLDEIQEKFTTVTGLSVTFTDASGEVLVQGNLPEFCQFCSLCSGRCEFISRVEADISGVSWLQCRYGLVAVKAPVVVSGFTIFCVLCGYVSLGPADASVLAAIDDLAAASRVPQEKLLSLLSSVRRVSKNRLITAAELLRVTADTLARTVLMAEREMELQEFRASLLKEQRQRAETEAELERAKLQLIEAQVNPHFLFNTLNTIAQTAVLEGSIETSRLVYALSDLLRFSLRKVGKLVTLGEELGNIRNYLYIQKQRFPDYFSYEIEVGQEEVLAVSVPALMLQPLVENAIIHGFPVSGRKGHIKIAAKTCRSRIVVSVVDNGAGMSAQRLAEVRSQIHGSGSAIPGPSHGLLAVVKRLRYYFGASSRVEIDSVEGCGTSVTLCWELNLPREDSQEGDSQ